MEYKDILKVIPLAQSTALLSENIPKKGKQFKPVKSAMGNIVGIELIKSTANLI